MKQISAALIALSIGIVPAHAQKEGEDGLSLMERGAQLFMEGILQQMEPTMDDLKGWADEMGPALRGFAEEMGPALADLMSEIEDWSVYHPPEILPNGDIIIRKKTPDETEDELELAPDGSIDL